MQKYIIYEKPAYHKQCPQQAVNENESIEINGPRDYEEEMKTKNEIMTRMHVSEISFSQNCLCKRIVFRNLNPVEKNEILKFINQQNKNPSPIIIGYQFKKSFQKQLKQQPIVFSSGPSPQIDQKFTISQQFDATSMQVSFQIPFQSQLSCQQKNELKQMQEYLKQRFEQMRGNLIEVIGNTQMIRYLRNI